MVPHFLTITCQHHGLPNTQLLELGNGFFTVSLDLVIDDNMSCILSVDSHVDNGSRCCLMLVLTLWAVVPLGTDSVHHLCIAHTHDVITYLCADALACYLLDIADVATVGSFFRESVAQCSSDRVGGVVLHMGSQMQQMMGVVSLRVYSLYGKLPVGQGTCLVEDDGSHLGEDVHIVRSLDEYSPSGSSSDAPEEGEGHTDDQRTWTTDNEEHEGSIEPCGKRTSQECRNDCEGDGGKHHYRRIDAGKAGDESFALRLMLAGMFHEIQDLRHRTLAKGLGDLNPDDT